MTTPFAIGALLMLLASGIGLGLLFRRAVRSRFQFSLKWLFAVTTLVALVLGVLLAWPHHVLDIQVPRIEAQPGQIHMTDDLLVLDIYRRAGRPVMRVTPRNDLGEITRVELFWLDSGTLRHATIAEQGQIVATSFSGPNEWPLLVGVVEYHPQVIEVTTRWVLPDGQFGGESVTHGSDAFPGAGELESWVKSALEESAKEGCPLLPPRPRTSGQR